MDYNLIGQPFHKSEPWKRAVDLVVRKVTDLQGCKATELAAESDVALGVGFPLPDVIEYCVEKGLIREVEYVLKEMNHRVKSFLLPKGTSVTFREGPY